MKKKGPDEGEKEELTDRVMAKRIRYTALQ